MCPDPQLLSIYMDGELPSPWKEKMETHLTECSECRGKFNNLAHLHGMFKIEKTEDEAPVGFALSERELMEKAKERVWQKLEAGHSFNSGRRVQGSGRIRNGGQFRSYNMLKRKLSIPLPVAVAAALVIALLAGFGIRGNSVNNGGFAYQNIDPVERTGFILAAEEEMPGIMPVGSDLNSVLQYLGVDRSEVIILQLPESRNFSRSGEPAIIRAADYRR
jgi:hypothetical protein